MTFVIPVASLIGTTLVFLGGFYLQNRSIGTSLRRISAEIKEHLAGVELRLSKELSEISRRLERIEETRG